MKLSVENIITLHDYFKNKPVTRAYLTEKAAANRAVVATNQPLRTSVSDHARVESLKFQDKRLDEEVNILVDLESGNHVALTFFKMKVELEDILNQKVDLVSSGGFSHIILKKSTHNEQLIYAKAG